MIRITSKVEGFRRAGLAHSVTPKEYPDGKFGKDQLAALKAEPMLIVEQIDEPEEKKSASGKGKKEGGK